jgi:hypothetical protein
MYTVLDNVLSNKDLEILQAQTKESFQEVETGYDNIVVRKPNTRVNNVLTNVVRQSFGGNLSEICAFLRKNTSSLDISFRVHADHTPLGDGQVCKVAAVFYLFDDAKTGTALFKHPKHGTTAVNEKVFTTNDGLWEAYEKTEAKANRLFIYDANLFHGRYPWRVRNDRYVVVKFLK